MRIRTEDADVTTSTRFVVQSTVRYLPEGMDIESGVSPEGQNTLVVDIHIRRSFVKKGSGSVQRVREDVGPLRIQLRRVDMKFLIPPLSS